MRLRIAIIRFPAQRYACTCFPTVWRYSLPVALFLADNMAADYYIKLKEDGFYERIISAGILCEIVVDSVRIDDTTYPYKAYTYGKTSIIRSSSIMYRNLETECQLLNSTRTENNPHGFMIEKWRVLDNSDIKEVKR